jgi:hypothetical protein
MTRGPGDFNGSGQTNVCDVAQLREEPRAGQVGASLDLTHSSKPEQPENAQIAMGSNCLRYSQLGPIIDLEISFRGLSSSDRPCNGNRDFVTIT